MIEAPAKNPCGSCPYRCDVPSGVWAASEYDRLAAYDAPALPEQPTSVFTCHQATGKLCAGWVGVHDMPAMIGLRLAVSMGSMAFETYEAVLKYKTNVPLFRSGAEACEHGKRDINAPREKARRTVAKLLSKPGLTLEER